MKLHYRDWVYFGFFTILAACCAAPLVATVRADDAGGAHWYKGNTHTHSLWSDGDEFPEMVADWYKSHGYDFLALTDHNILATGERWRNVGWGRGPVPLRVLEKCQSRFGGHWLVLRGGENRREVQLKTFNEIAAKLGEPGRFLLIQGEEITLYDPPHVHVNALNLAELIPPRREPLISDTIASAFKTVAQQSRRLRRPMLACLNHPNWNDYDIPPEELAAASAARFFEVCNAGTGAAGHPYGDQTHPSVEKLWDVANTIRIGKMKAPPLYGIGSDDSHFFQEFSPNKPNPGRAWIVVRAKRLDPASLIEAMERGDFYASSGVTLRDVAFDSVQRTITVKVKAEPGVQYSIEFIGTLQGVNPEGMPAPSGKNSRRPGRVYSAEVGKVLARTHGDVAEYRMTGRELYVRAVVRSDKPMANAAKGAVQRQEAWCQPVGWQSASTGGATFGTGRDSQTIEGSHASSLGKDELK